MLGLKIGTKGAGQPQITAKKSSPFFRRIPIVMVEEDSVILEDFSKLKSFIIETPGIEGIDPRVIAFEAEKMDYFLRNLSANNSFIQFSSLVSKNIKPLLDKHRDMAKGNILLESVAEQRVKIFENEIEYTLICTIVVPLSVSATVDGKKNKTATPEDFKKRDRESKECESMLIDTLFPLGYKIKPLSGPDFMGLLCSVINPDEAIPDMHFSLGELLPLRKRLFLSDFFVDDIGITNGRYKFASLVMDVMPTPLRPMTGSMFLSNIKFPLLYNLTILNEDQNRVMDSLENQRKMAVMFSGKKSAAAVSNTEKIRAIDEMRSDKAKEGWKLVRTFVSFLVWDTDDKMLNEKLSIIRAAVSKELEGSGLFTEWLRKESAFIASLPGCATRSYDMLFTTSFDAAGLIPMRGVFRGDRDEPVMLFKNHFHSVTALNPFSKKQNKWAGIVVGPSGSGKSVFMNNFILSATVLKPFIMIVDMATMPSYEPLVNILGGSFIPVSLSDSFRVNMFDLRVGMEEPIGTKILSLDSMLTSMISDQDQSYLEKEMQAVLQRAVKRLYRRVFTEEPKKIKAIRIPPEIHETVISQAPVFEYCLEYRDFYLSKFKETGNMAFYNKAEMAQSLGTPTLNDFIQTLSVDEALVTNKKDREVCDDIKRILSLYAQGPQSVLFNGITNLVINNDVYCFHLGMVKERKEVLAMLILLYRDFAFRKSIFFPSELPAFFNEMQNISWVVEMQKRPKLFVYDEFHNLKGHSSLNIILDILDKDARQQRTLGMATYLATQEINDIALGGKNFLSASANKYFTRHISPENPNLQSIDQVEQAIGMNESDKKCLTNLTFYPGRYAEIYALCEDVGKGVLQNIQTPIERWLFSTHKDERYVRDTIVQAILRKGKSQNAAQAIAAKALSSMFPEGTIGKDIDPDDILKKIESDGYL